jgi:hypothetical protein
MAGNGDSEIVRRARAGDGAHRLRRSNAPSDFGVRNRLADGNLLERLPYTLLEGRGADVERKIEADPRGLNEADNPRDQALIVTIGANEMRVRKAVLEIADELVRIVREQDRGDALLALGDEDGTERSLPNSESDLLVDAAGAVL